MKKFLLSFAAWAARWLPMPVKRMLYRLPFLSGAIRRSLNLAAPQGLSEVTVAAGDLAGMKLSLDLHSEKDYWLGTYEPELQKALRRWVQPGMLAYDVGANIGYLSLLLARRVGETGQVYAFEALPANQERLRANLALNDLQERVTVVPAAVVDRAGEMRFWVGPSGGMGKAEGSAGRENVAYQEAIQVTGTSLDEFAYQQGNPLPQVVKMDIEGGEVLALPGMRRLLVEARPRLLLELHGPQAAQVAWEILTAAGYRLCEMHGDYPQIPSLADLNWKAYVVALPD